MKRIRIPGIITASLLLVSLSAPAALAARAPADGNGGFIGEPFVIEAGRDAPKDDQKYSGLKPYDMFFERLVTEGAISAEQKDAIKTAIENAVKDARQQGLWKIDLDGILETLVSGGTITQEQRTAVLGALKAERRSFMTRRLKGAMESLVSAGTITRSEAEKILSAVTEAVNSGDGEDMHELLESLRKSGAINEGQFLALKKALKPPHHDKKQPQAKPGDKKSKNPA